MVHLARHQQTGAAVALKLVVLDGSDEEPLDTRRARFITEAQALRHLTHRHIAAVLDVGQADGLGWIAVEWVPGSDLTRYTRAPRLLPEPMVCHVGASVCEALACAHDLGVVHRDIKPSNVLVNLPQRVVKLCDFGLARGHDDAQATRTGVVLGSPAFLAPEQLGGAVPNASSDLYAVGAMLYQLLTGQLPFDAPSMGELLRQVAQDDAPNVQAANAQVSAGMARLVASLLRKSAAERPHAAADVAQTLRAWAGPAHGRDSAAA